MSAISCHDDPMKASASPFSQRFISPLRYPGGKARLSPYITQLIAAQRPRPHIYAEPFAGGAGAAVTMLAQGVVDEIAINDLNPGVAAFWRAVFHDGPAFADLVRRRPVTIKAWHQNREIYLNPDGRADLELGFATFFLNRCNRSGILTARPIGGLDQTGNWLIDARFNRSDLAARIEYLGNFRHRVDVSQLDAIDFLAELESRGNEVLAYVDPPYLGQGDQLYLDKLSMDDHRALAKQLVSSQLRWFMTYDCDDRITDELYPNLRCAQFDISHTAQTQHIGSEFAVFSDNLNVHGLGLLPRDDAAWIVS